MFSNEELERYARHIVLRDVGGPGQQKLKSAKVLVIGAGGLGAPVLSYLAAAGVGTLGCVDDDHVSLSNLQRQIIHDTENINMAKTKSAEHAIQRINPHVTFNAHSIRLDRNNGPNILKDYDFVADGTDNFASRYAIADMCEQAEIPLVTAAVGQFDGSITTLKPYEPDKNGALNPGYRDLFPSPPPDGSIPTCAQAGVLGALTGVIGSMQALEIIKEIIGIGEGLVGRLLLYDARACRFETINYKRRSTPA
ncbi:MAG: thiamine biosynthesis protein ThiF [Hyphomicrobiales bacterium]|nr:MAG: thiamine biosynthesis protein ThiF [Hyphomicrobiales bacterium]